LSVVGDFEILLLYISTLQEKLKLPMKFYLLVKCHYRRILTTKYFMINLLTNLPTSLIHW